MSGLILFVGWVSGYITTDNWYGKAVLVALIIDFICTIIFYNDK